MRDEDEWSPTKHPQEKFKRTRTTREQAQKEQKKVWKCAFCSKEYQSYPALYTHTKQKHSGQEISSKGMENSGHGPVKKMKSILSQTNSPLEELERDLLKSAKTTCLSLFQQLSPQFKISTTDVSTVYGSFDLAPLFKQAEQLAAKKNLPSRLIPSLNSSILSDLQIRIGKVSFGKEILGFFRRSAIGGQICLQLGVLQKGEEVGVWEERIWGRKMNFRWLSDEWQKWSSTVSRLQEVREGKEGSLLKVEEGEGKQEVTRREGEIRGEKKREQ